MAQFKIYLQGETENPEIVSFHNEKGVEFAKIEKKENQYFIIYGGWYRSGIYSTYWKAFEALDAIVFEDVQKLGYSEIQYNS